MDIKSISIGLFLFIFCINPLIASTLVIEVNDIKNKKGQILVALFDQSEGFPSDQDKSIRRKVGYIIDGKATITFTNLPEGNYAAAIVHDLDNDSEIDKNWIGVPTEGYGFSMIMKPGLWIPSFEQSVFSISEAVKKIAIKLYYSPFAS
jgi:uncharacterized protein (DUF2141 family)